jgi:tetratricopeptide (TPR) repeat protein
MRPPAGLLSGLLLAASALAGDGQVVLRFRDGRLLPGKAVEVSDKGVRHVAEQGTAFWPWEVLTGYSQYEVRASVAAEDDGAARLALGRWCLDAGLPAEARKEILRARGLGTGEAPDLDALLARCDREQAGRAFAEAERRAASGDLDAALAVLRSFLVQAPPSEWTEKGRERASDLVRRKEAEEVRRRLDEERRKRDDAETKRAAFVAGSLADADAARTRAGILALAGLREESGGSFSIFRQSLEKAASEYLVSRREYDRARKVAGEEHPEEFRLALAGRHAANGRLLDVYLRLARKFVDFKDWKDAQAVLDRALRLDPVNAEALELQDTVNRNWIHRKATDLTNASGHTSSGTTDE